MTKALFRTSQDVTLYIDKYKLNVPSNDEVSCSSEFVNTFCRETRKGC